MNWEGLGRWQYEVLELGELVSPPGNSSVSHDVGLDLELAFFQQQDVGFG